MKSYRETAEEVLRRIEAHKIAQKKRQRTVTLMVVTSLFLCLAVGLTLLLGSRAKNDDPPMSPPGGTERADGQTNVTDPPGTESTENAETSEDMTKETDTGANMIPAPQRGITDYAEYLNYVNNPFVYSMADVQNILASGEGIFYTDKFIHYEDLFPGQEAYFREFKPEKQASCYTYFTEFYEVARVIFGDDTKGFDGWCQYCHVSPEIFDDVLGAIEHLFAAEKPDYDDGYNRYYSSAVQIDDIRILYVRSTTMPQYETTDCGMYFTIGDVDFLFTGFTNGDEFSDPVMQEYFETESLRKALNRLKEAVATRGPNVILPEGVDPDLIRKRSA